METEPTPEMWRKWQNHKSNKEVWCEMEEAVARIVTYQGRDERTRAIESYERGVINKGAI